MNAKTFPLIVVGAVALVALAAMLFIGKTPLISSPLGMVVYKTSCSDTCPVAGQSICDGSGLKTCVNLNGCLQYILSNCANGCSQGTCRNQASSCESWCTDYAQTRQWSWPTMCTAYKDSCGSCSECAHSDAGACQSWCIPYERDYGASFPDYFSWNALCTNYSEYCGGCSQCK